MQNEPENPTQTPDEIIAQIARLMAEAEALVAGPAAAPATDRFLSLRERFSELQERAAELYGDARHHVITSARRTDEAIRTHPYESVALALGIGVLLGAVLRSTGD